jgi:hypothetical protein
MPAHLIVALFDGAAAARGAADRLAAMGVNRGAVRLVPEDGAAPGARVVPPAGEATGFWCALAGLHLPEADRYGYAEGVGRGGVLLAVSVAAPPNGEVVHVLEEAGAVDLDQREDEWWACGWRGYRPGRCEGRGGRRPGAAPEEEGWVRVAAAVGQSARVRRYRASGTS